MYKIKKKSNGMDTELEMHGHLFLLKKNIQYQ